MTRVCYGIELDQQIVSHLGELASELLENFLMTEERKKIGVKVVSKLS